MRDLIESEPHVNFSPTALFHSDTRTFACTRARVQRYVITSKPGYIVAVPVTSLTFPSRAMPDLEAEIRVTER